MADITYCDYAGCPIKKCERHPSKISKACMNGKGYVSVADFAGSCRNYISHLVDKIEREGEKNEARKKTNSKTEKVSKRSETES